MSSTQCSKGEYGQHGEGDMDIKQTFQILRTGDIVLPNPRQYKMNR